MRSVFIASSAILAVSAEQFPEIIANIAPYPGYEGDIKPFGQVKLNGDATTVKLGFLMGDMEKDATGGIHIHTGTSCETAEAVGGHYWNEELLPNAEDDPWNPMQWDSSSPGFGFANGEVVIENNQAYGYNEMVGRAVVVHDSAGNRIACTVLAAEASTTAGTTSGCVKTPDDYEGDIEIDGEVNLIGDAGANELTWFLTGFQAGQTGTIEIYDGKNCNHEDGIGSQVALMFWAAADNIDEFGGAMSGSHTFDQDQFQYVDLVDKLVIVNDPEGNAVGCAKLDNCSKGSGLGSGSALPPGVPVKCGDMAPDNHEGDDFCSLRTGGELGYNRKQRKKKCHHNKEAGELAIEKACEPLCCCKKRWKTLRSKKCKKYTNEDLAALPKCDMFNNIGDFCRAGGEKVPGGGTGWDVNNCGDGYDIFEVKCKK